MVVTLPATQVVIALIAKMGCFKRFASCSFAGSRSVQLASETVPTAPFSSCDRNTAVFILKTRPGFRECPMALALVFLQTLIPYLCSPRTLRAIPFVVSVDPTPSDSLFVSSA